MAGSRALTEFKKLTLDSLQLGDEFVSDDHLVIPEDIEAHLHARMEFTFVEPIKLGMRVRTRGKVIDKYERRGKPYMVTEYVTEDDAGRVLVRGQFTQMIIVEPEASHGHAR
jgi:acyl-coenzyme A thioesterase PaaI-like protein